MRFSATKKGAKLLAAGRTRRVLTLARSMDQLSDADRKALRRAMDILDDLMPRWADDTRQLIRLIRFTLD